MMRSWWLVPGLASLLRLMFLSFAGLAIREPMPAPDSPKCRQGASRKNTRAICVQRRMTLPRQFQWNECLRPPSPFILSPRRGNSIRLFLVFPMSVRPFQSYKFSKERRTNHPLLGERAGVRADVIFASMLSWLTTVRLSACFAGRFSGRVMPHGNA